MSYRTQKSPLNTSKDEKYDEPDIITLEARNRSSERLISHLNLQVDCLQQTNNELEERIRELEDSKAAATSESMRHQREVDRLHTELRDIDTLAQQLEGDKQEAIKTADREIHDAQMELRLSQRQESDLHLHLKEAESNEKKLMQENESLQVKLARAEADNQTFNELLKKVQQDKKMLSNRISSLTAREKKLVMELEQYRVNPNKTHRRNKSPSKLDSFVRTLEQERDYYKSECDVLNTLIQEKGKKNKSLSRSRGRSQSPQQLMKSHPTIKGVHPEKYEKVLQERNELQKILDKFELQMAEVQANVKVISQDRDKANTLYQHVNEELQRVRREAVRGPKSPKASLTAQAILRRVENERDQTMTDLRRMSTERDSLRERLKIQQEQAVTERSRLEQRVDDMADKVRMLDHERMELQGRIDSLKNLNMNQEEDIRCLRLKLQDSESELQEAKSHLEELRILKAQVEASLENSQRHLSRKSTDLNVAEERIKSLEDRVSDLQETQSKQSDEIGGLRATLASVDRDKDDLQLRLDEKTEKVSLLEESLSRKDDTILENKLTISSLQTQLDRLKEDLESIQREERSVRRMLENTQTQLQESNLAKESGFRDNRRLQDDLSTMSRENQDITMDLEDIMHERDQLRMRAQESNDRIANLEHSINSKEQELQDVLEQYRKMSTEKDSVETKCRVSIEEVQSLKYELMASENEKNRMNDKLNSLDRENLQHCQTEKSYEEKISDLQMAVHRFEGDLQRISDERSSLQSDLASARDLNAKLDNSKEQISRQFASRSIEYEQLKANYDEISREADIVHKHLDEERATCKNLEDLVSNSREKEFQAQLDSQESKSENQLLRDKLALNESKLQSLSREVSSLRTRASQIDAELEVTKRHLTNERYERERAVQELRRNGLPSPGFPRISDNNSPSRPRSGSPSRVTFFDQR